jgi:hypothetical protein
MMERRERKKRKKRTRFIITIISIVWKLRQGGESEREDEDAR